MNTNPEVKHRSFYVSDTPDPKDRACTIIRRPEIQVIAASIPLDVSKTIPRSCPKIFKIHEPSPFNKISTRISPQF